jgi:protein involved in polysaccharide export with SLBB domain
MRWLWLSLSLPLLATGCSNIASTLGFTPDRHPLLEEAARQRQYRIKELPHELQKTLLEPYILEPGDGLLLLPADLDSPVRLPSDQTILQDGTIDLGRYGTLMVAGKTVPEVETLVRDAVSKITPDSGFIDVRLVGRQSKVYYVLGEVQTPGKFPISGSETVLDGLLQAGGLTDKASQNKIILVRPTLDGCATLLAVDYSRIVQLGDTGLNYQLQPGDRIFVPTRGFKEQFNGHFNR